MMDPLELWKAGVIQTGGIWLSYFDFDTGAFDLPEEDRKRKLEYMFYRIDQLLQRPWEL